MEKTIKRELLTKVGPFRWLCRLAVAGLFIGAMLSPPPSISSVPADEGRISGVVKDANGARISGTRITVVNAATGATKETRTDENGAYSISGLVAGTYSVMAETPGFQTARYSESALADKQFLQLNFALRVRPVQAGETGISGVVKDTTGALIPGTKITVVNAGTEAARETRTDGNGTYSISGLVAGTYSVMAEIPGFQTARYSNAALAEKQSLQLNFALRIGKTTVPIELSVP